MPLNDHLDLTAVAVEAYSVHPSGLHDLLDFETLAPVSPLFGLLILL